MRNNVFIFIIVALSLVALVMGFMLVGSPQKSRAINLDRQRLQDISDLRSSIENYYRDNQSLPETLDNISIPESRIDPETKQPYEYKFVFDTKYEICATFSADLDPDMDSYYLPTGEERAYYKKGHSCIPYTIPDYFVPTTMPVPVIKVLPSSSGSGDIVY